MALQFNWLERWIVYPEVAGSSPAKVAPFGDNEIETMDLDLSDKKNTYIYPLIEDAEVGQLITTGKYILEVVEIDRSQQLMIVQKVV